MQLGSRGSSETSTRNLSSADLKIESDVEDILLICFGSKLKSFTPCCSMTSSYFLDELAGQYNCNLLPCLGCWEEITLLFILGTRPLIVFQVYKNLYLSLVRYNEYSLKYFKVSQ